MSKRSNKNNQARQSLDAIHDNKESKAEGQFLPGIGVRSQEFPQLIGLTSEDLMTAANEGTVLVVRVLLETAQGNPKLLEEFLTQVQEDGFTALMLAAYHGHADVVIELLKAARSYPVLLAKMLTHATKEGFTALMLAASMGHAVIVTELLEAAQSDMNLVKQMLSQQWVNKDDKNDKRTALVFALLKKGHREVVISFLDAVLGNSELIGVLIAQGKERGFDLAGMFQGEAETLVKGGAEATKPLKGAAQGAYRASGLQAVLMGGVVVMLAVEWYMGLETLTFVSSVVTPVQRMGFIAVDMGLAQLENYAPGATLGVVQAARRGVAANIVNIDAHQWVRMGHIRRFWGAPLLPLPQNVQMHFGIQAGGAVQNPVDQRGPTARALRREADRQAKEAHARWVEANRQNTEARQRCLADEARARAGILQEEEAFMESENKERQAIKARAAEADLKVRAEARAYQEECKKKFAEARGGEASASAPKVTAPPSAPASAPLTLAVTAERVQPPMPWAPPTIRDGRVVTSAQDPATPPALVTPAPGLGMPLVQRDTASVAPAPASLPALVAAAPAPALPLPSSSTTPSSPSLPLSQVPANQLDPFDPAFQFSDEGKDPDLIGNSVVDDAVDRAFFHSDLAELGVDVSDPTAPLPSSRTGTAPQAGSIAGQSKGAASANAASQAAGPSHAAVGAAGGARSTQASLPETDAFTDEVLAQPTKEELKSRGQGRQPKKAGDTASPGHHPASGATAHYSGHAIGGQAGSAIGQSQMAAAGAGATSAANAVSIHVGPLTMVLTPAAPAQPGQTPSASGIVALPAEKAHGIGGRSQGVDAWQAAEMARQTFGSDATSVTVSEKAWVVTVLTRNGPAIFAGVYLDGSGHKVHAINIMPLPNGDLIGINPGAHEFSGHGGFNSLSKQSDQCVRVALMGAKQTLDVVVSHAFGLTHNVLPTLPTLPSPDHSSNLLLVWPKAHEHADTNAPHAGHPSSLGHPLLATFDVAQVALAVRNLDAAVQKFCDQPSFRTAGSLAIGSLQLAAAVEVRMNPASSTMRLTALGSTTVWRGVEDGLDYSSVKAGLCASSGVLEEYVVVQLTLAGVFAAVATATLTPLALAFVLSAGVDTTVKRACGDAYPQPQQLLWESPCEPITSGYFSGCFSCSKYDDANSEYGNPEPMIVCTGQAATVVS